MRMTTVRTKVAKSELTFSTPIFAKIAVSAAKAADSSAHACQLDRRIFTPNSTLMLCCRKVADKTPALLCQPQSVAVEKLDPRLLECLLD
jgi:hypothetical protein